MGTFMAECYWPGMTEDRVREILHQVGQAARRRRTDVRQLGSFLVPSDGMVIFLFEGTSLRAIQEAAELADVPFDRIVECRHITARGPAPETGAGFP
jgi:Protein of unknown function (DUF4242)